MKQVSKSKYLTAATAHTNFSDDALINEQIKSGEWRSLIADAITIDDLRQFFMTAYHLEDYILDRLEFFYVTKVGSNGNTKKIVIGDMDNYTEKVIRTEHGNIQYVLVGSFFL